METHQIVVFALAVVLAAVLFRVVLRRSARRSEASWLPAELRHASLEFAEQTFCSNGPIPIVARIDRGYRIGNMIHLAEFKTRAVMQAYRSDVIELSAQKVAVEDCTGFAVSNVGYVLINDVAGGRRRLKKVNLLSRSEVMALAVRREQILNRSTMPKFAEKGALCRKCAYRQECRPNIE